MKSLLEGEVESAGNSSSVAAPHNVYRCKDGRWCAVAVAAEGEWRGLKKALGNPSWAEDEKFDALSGRLLNKDELDRSITGWTQQHTAEDVMSRLQKNGVAAGIVQDAAGLSQDPQLQARGFFIRDKRMPLVDAAPIKMSKLKVEYQREAPAPGRDNTYIYGKLLGIGPQEMIELRKSRVI